MAKQAVEDFSELGSSGAATEVLANDGPAIEAATSKMSEIFGRNDAQNQADELEDEGLEGPNDPDGKTRDEVDAEAEEARIEAGKDLTEEEAAAKLEEEEAAEAARLAEGEQLTPEEIEQQKVLDAFDPNLKRVAKELGGWGEQDIKDFIASNPVLAKVTFSNMAAGYNALSLQYAQGVRQPVQGVQQSQQQVAAIPANVSALDELLSKPEKLKALQEIAGEELTAAFIKPLLEERKALNEDRAFIANLRKEALVREIGDSFADVSKGGFEDFYGKTGEVTKDQNDNRYKVGQLADQIRSGAQLQGVNMGVNEAIRRAHLIVTADQHKAQERRKIAASVTRRATQITSRATARKPKATEGTRGDGAAIQSIEDFWADRGS